MAKVWLDVVGTPNTTLEAFRRQLAPAGLPDSTIGRLYQSLLINGVVGVPLGEDELRALSVGEQFAIQSGKVPPSGAKIEVRVTMTPSEDAIRWGMMMSDAERALRSAALRDCEVAMAGVGWEGFGKPAIQRVEATEAVHESTSADVGRVLDHLRNNRTTEREASDLQEAARRSIADHASAKSLRGSR